MSDLSEMSKKTVESLARFIVSGFDAAIETDKQALRHSGSRLGDQFVADMVNVTIETIEQRAAIQRVGFIPLTEYDGGELEASAVPAPRYPQIVIPLADQRASGSHLARAVKVELERIGVDPVEVAEFMTEATGGDFDHLLRVVLAYVRVS